MVQVKVLKDISVMGMGLIKAGQEVELHPSVADLFAEKNCVEIYKTKVVQQEPEKTVKTKKADK